MPCDIDDTIAAIATPPGGAWRGVVRISGPRSVACVATCFTPDSDVNLSRLCRATVIAGALQIPGIRSPLPCAAYLWPTPRSFTRQPAAELHTLGSPPLLEAVVETLCTVGARPASPGEFTLRAFLAGRIDLTQAEAVLGVIDANSAGQLDVALAQLAGGMARPIVALRDALLDLRAELEAGLDFVDEDVEFISTAQLERQLATAARTVAQLARRMAERRAARPAVQVVITGQPNVGKSSLLNALVGRRVALTGPQGGTTRDVLTARLDLDGLACQLVDTAGRTHDHLPSGPERSAQEMARTARNRAVVRLFCVDAGRPLDRWERSQIKRAAELAQIVVLTKVDQPRGTDLAGPAVATSSRTGQGIATLRACLREAVLAALHRPTSTEPGSVVADTAARCRESLHRTATAVARARRLAATGGGEELVAAELGDAIAQLGKVVGVVYTDDLLDRVFGRFCIGK